MKQFDVLKSSQDVHQALNGVVWEQKNEIVLLELDGGLTTFADVAFRGLGFSRILAKKVEREAEGRGPHFDVYDDLLHPEFPYIGLYNLTGPAHVTATALPKDMADAYRRDYPSHSEAAAEARRKFGFVALALAGNTMFTGNLKPRTGLILPQIIEEPLVHEVLPYEPSNPGSFIKLVVANSKIGAAELLGDNDYISLDELLTQSVGGLPKIEQNRDSVQPDREKITIRPPRRRDVSRGGRRMD